MNSIPGLIIVNDFLTEEEEQHVLNFIPKQKARSGVEERNSVQRFGSNFPYQNGFINHTIPAIFETLVDKMIKASLLTERQDSVSINEYHVGNTIAPHVDNKRSGETITIISLLGNAVMKFDCGPLTMNFDVPPRSLLQIRGEARWKWKHSILPVTETRYSIVFRKSKKD